MSPSGNIDLSVIIPVYNAGPHLKECIDSILASETVSVVEIIIVDDGSSDGSEKTADQYAAINDNITVIHKANGGTSEARNIGLEHAGGKYVFFCDADDLVMPNLLSRVIEASETYEPDVILWDGDVEDIEGSKVSRKYKRYFIHKSSGAGEALTGKDALCRQLKTLGDFPTVIWLAAYRRSFLLDNGLLFKEGILHEDDLWIPQVMLSAGSTIYLPELLYVYRIHGGSLSRPSGDEKSAYIESLLKVFPYLYEYSDKKLSHDPDKKYVDAWLTRKYLHWIFEYDFYRYGYGDKIDKSCLWKTSKRLWDKVRVLLLFIRG